MRKIAVVLSLIVFTAFLVIGALIIRPFGYPSHAEVDDYIIANTQRDTGANSAVTAVVFDYRGYDTLGEATILFTSVAAVVMLFRRRKRE